MMNFSALNWFDSFIKKLKKALNCIIHVIYTYVTIGCVYLSLILTWLTMEGELLVR